MNESESNGGKGMYEKKYHLIHLLTAEITPSNLGLQGDFCTQTKYETLNQGGGGGNNPHRSAQFLPDAKI